MPKSIPMYQGGDGSSASNAVAITNACGTRVGLEAEKRWLQDTLGGGAIVGQGVRESDRTVLDVIRWLDSGGNEHTVFFDITSFHGDNARGTWVFVPDQGQPTNGWVSDSAASPFACGFWQKLIGSRTGVATCQKEWGNDAGYIAYGALTNGMLTGQWRLFRYDGRQALFEFRDDEAEGIQVEWNQDREPAFAWRWENGKPHGAWERWRGNEMHQTDMFVHGVQHGTSTVIDAKGNLREMAVWENGVAVGTAKQWNAKGALIGGFGYRDGSPWEGVWMDEKTGRRFRYQEGRRYEEDARGRQ